MSTYTGNLFDIMRASLAQRFTPAQNKRASRAVGQPGTVPQFAEPDRNHLNPVLPDIRVQSEQQGAQSQLANPSNAYWGNAGNHIGVQAEGVINDMVSGNAMNAYRVQQNAALNRAEQNQRAGAAAQVQRAGFAGTPVGAAAANAAESNMLRNRFDANLGLEVERQNMRQQGAAAAMQYADTVNRFNTEYATNRQKVYEDAGRLVAADYDARRDEYAKLGIEGMTDADMDRLRQQAPTMVHAMQNMWSAMTGAEGDVPMWFIQSQHASLSNPKYGNMVMQYRDMISEAFPDWSPAEVEGFVALVMVGGVKWNAEKGEWEIDRNLLNGAESKYPAANVDNPPINIPANVPPFTLPHVEVPPVNIPQVNLPPVNIPQVAPPNINIQGFQF
jgi:hypothetical protein